MPLRKISGVTVLGNRVQVQVKIVDFEYFSVWCHQVVLEVVNSGKGQLLCEFWSRHRTDKIKWGGKI